MERAFIVGSNSAGSVSTDVKNAGGNYLNEPVVVDGNLVTSRFPPDMPVWLPAILRQLE